MDEQLSSAALAGLIAHRAETLLDALPRAIVVVDRDGIIVGWNMVAARFYGFERDEALGRSLYELVTPPEFRATGRALMDDVLAGATWSGNIRALRKDGTQPLTFSFLAPLRDRAGSIVGAVGAADDSSDLRHLQQQTTDLADHLKLALSAGQLGTWRWDIESGVTTWDDTMEHLFGLASGGFGGTFDDYVALLHPDEVDVILATVADAVDRRSSYAIEHRVMWPDGTVHWLQGRGQVTLDADGNVTGTIGCSIDVSDRKLLEETSIRRVHDAEAAATRERLERERLEFLASLNDVANPGRTHADAMDRVAAAVVPRLGDWCQILYRPQSGPQRMTLAHSNPDRAEWARQVREKYPYNPDGVMGIPAVMRSGEPQFLRDLTSVSIDEVSAATGVDRDELALIAQVLRLTSVITVPMTTGRGMVGAMQFVSAESGRHYDDTDLALAEATAGRVAAMLDNAWLLEQQRQIAATLQAALLPAKLPAIDGVSVAVRYWAAGAVAEVGGDFYDVFQIAPNRWALVIGDVCGTGPAAAAVTAVARHTIRAAAMHGAGHVEVLQWVNDAILSGTTGLFCTVLYSTMELRSDGTWLYTSVAGGHPLPMLVDGMSGSGTGAETSMLGVHGTLIGVLAEINVTPSEVILRPGSTLVMHTDGVNDVKPPHDLDDDMLRQLVGAAVATAGSADAVAERLGDAIAAVLPIPERDDDVAVVVVRIDWDHTPT